MTEEQARQIEADVDAEVNASIEFAENSPPADEKWLTSGVYAKQIDPKF